MRDIGDRHAQLESLGGFLAPHGVVKIFGVLPVDGHKRHIAQIYPVGFICLGRLFAERARLAEHLIWPLPGYAVGANGDVDLKPRVQMITEDFLDLTLGTQSGRGVIREDDRYQLSMTGAALGFGWDQNVIANARVVGEQKADAALFHVTADHFGMRPGEHLNNLTLCPATTIQTCD